MVKTTPKGGIIVDEKAYKKIKLRLVEMDMNEKMLAEILNVDKSLLNRVTRGLSANSELRKKIEKYLKISIWN